MTRSKGKGKHTQSLSLRTVGTPISSKVLGPLPPGFWPAGFEAGGLGVDGFDSFCGAGSEATEAADGEPTAGRGELIGADTGVLAGFRSGAPSRRGGRRRESAAGDPIGAENPISSLGVPGGLRICGGLPGPAGCLVPFGWR